jgi:hypothetical protein
VTLTITFVSVGLYGFMMRLPPAPRALAVQLLREPDGAVAAVQGGLPYAERQEVTVRLPAGERYSLEVRDDGR